jgi:thiol-disulfide isomerase/thioredoxin
MRFEGTVLMPDADGEVNYIVATDNNEAFRIEPAKEVYTVGKLSKAFELISPAYWVYMREFLHKTPFSDEINAKSVKYEGEQLVGDVACHVVYVVYANDTESRWYFGKDDNLPRRVDRISARGDTALVVTELKVAPEFGAETFHPRCPEGYETKVYEPPARKPKPELLSMGSEAPDWELKTPEGTTVRLKELRGNVVVMDFWATWCGPCKSAMPGVQKLHEEFAGKPVKVFGVNCWESGDAAKYMRQKGYTYGLLLNADKVADAYHVSGIPTFYVIDPAGRIAHADVGAGPDHEKKLGKMIKAALQADE